MTSRPGCRGTRVGSCLCWQSQVTMPQTFSAPCTPLRFAPHPTPALPRTLAQAGCFLPRLPPVPRIIAGLLRTRPASTCYPPSQNQVEKGLMSQFGCVPSIWWKWMSCPDVDAVRATWGAFGAAVLRLSVSLGWVICTLHQCAMRLPLVLPLCCRPGPCSTLSSWAASRRRQCWPVSQSQDRRDLRW